MVWEGVIMAKQWMKIQLDGHPYRLDLEGFDGINMNPFAPSKEGLVGDILLPNGFKKTKKSMYLVVHELLHGADWGMTEEKVIQVAEDLTNVLWRLYSPRKNIK